MSSARSRHHSLTQDVEDGGPAVSHGRQASLERGRQLTRVLDPLAVAVDRLRHLLEAG
jgi:hypothetical protein